MLLGLTLNRRRRIVWTFTLREPSTVYSICPQKCDGTRPKCHQCSRSSSLNDCEYADAGPSRAQMLEEQIANVEARIQELEPPRTISSNIVLNNPHRRPSGPSRLCSLCPLILHRIIGNFYRQVGCPVSCQPLHNQVELNFFPSSIHNFLHHSSQFGFFLNVLNFREAAMGRGGQRIAPVLLHVVQLWAVHLSGSDEFTSHEGRYLSRALRTTADALSETQRNTVIHSIQAKVLLANYFFSTTRFLEGKYHLSAAVSLVISSGLHRIRSAASARTSGPACRVLPPPRDAIEEGERISAFWAVLTLNNCWMTADGSPSNISYTDPGARIDTPWPLDIDGPVQNQLLANPSTGTVNNFLANRPDSGTSKSAFHAKAAILFEQASRVASQYHPNMNNKREFYASFNSIDTVIERFKLSLPTVQMHSSREMVVIHGLAHVATIQLHNPFVVDNQASRLRVLDSARAVVAYLAQVPLNEYGYINPIMGTLWMATCQAFVSELLRFKRHLPPSTRPASAEERSLVDAIETVLAAMSVFAPNCQLMSLCIPSDIARHSTDTVPVDSQLIAMRQMYRGS
ncbi:hypothetical protein DFH06DRAFT_1103978 [Mycena polygramma]|nr:hypothetical protein DFH06DRAFT_1103978 [Mycena polygramma]